MSFLKYGILFGSFQICGRVKTDLQLLRLWRSQLINVME